MAEGNREIKQFDLLVLQRVDPQPAGEGKKYGSKGFVIRVVRWSGEKSNGSGEWSTIKLERRELFLSPEGGVRNGKAEGFKLDDLIMIKSRWDDIIAAMHGMMPQQQTPAAAPQEPGGEVPF